MNKMELLAEIESCLNTYTEILLDEHKEELMALYALLIAHENQIIENVSDGKHFQDCGSSADECDTCRCYFIHRRIQKCVKLCLLYKRICMK